MNDLIKVEEYEGQPMVSARELWDKLESKRQFGNWIADRISDFE